MGSSLKDFSLTHVSRSLGEQDTNGSVLENTMGGCSSSQETRGGIL
jgi:hypothetical protein